MNPFVFLVGCARSGTTLLQRIVNAHGQIAITPEMHWITNSFRHRKQWLAPEGRVTPEQVLSMVRHNRFRQFEFTREEFEGLIPAGEPTPYVTFLNGIFALYGKNKGKNLVGNKTPAYVKGLATLHAHWPTAKFVHLIRDGRDVCLSVLDWDHAHLTAGRYATWAEDPVSTTALWWKRKVLLGRQYGRPLGRDLYYEIRYESLVTQPPDECAKLCTFLGVPFDPAMLRFHEGRTRTDPGLDAKQAWLPITPGLRDWNTQMSAENIERFEAGAGDLLDELGYPRAFPRPSPDSMKRASRIRDLFTQELCSPTQGAPGALVQDERSSTENHLKLFHSLSGARTVCQERFGVAAGGASPNPYVFIVGCPRSGTTLLMRIVNAHSQIAIVPETDWIADYYQRRIGLTPEGAVTRDLVARLLEHRKIGHLGVGARELEGLFEASPTVGYASFVGRLFDHYGGAEGKFLVGDKTPNYVRKIRVLHRLWPRAKFVHLIRDGRDVCLSVLDWKRKAARLAELYPTWEEDPVTTAALCWDRDVGEGRAQGRWLGSEVYYEVRYESLVARPQEEVEGLCAFLGLPYERGMLEFHQDRTRSEPGLSPKHAWLPITPGLRDWRRQMQAADVERFEAAAGERLDELSYPRACPSLQVAVCERAARLRDRLAQALATRKGKLTCGTEAPVGGER
jgi:hypothetical protein